MIKKKIPQNVIISEKRAEAGEFSEVYTVLFRMKTTIESRPGQIKYLWKLFIHSW